MGNWNMEKERIICAAIWFDDGNKYDHQPVNINTGFVITGMRHHNCFQTLVIISEAIDKHTKFEKQQGFITTLNKFVSRERAAKIAYKSGQTKYDVGKLFSEDLY